jgi:PAS domain S-box-containing protein
MTARLENDGQLVGMLSVSISKKRARDSREHRRFQEFASSLGAELGCSITDQRCAPVDDALMILASAAATSPGAGFVTDPGGIVRHVNASCLELWGYEDREEVVGRAAATLWDSEEIHALVQSTLEEQGRWTGTLAAKRKDLSLVEVEASARIVTSEGGEPLGVAYSCRLVAGAGSDDESSGEKALASVGASPASDDTTWTATEAAAGGKGETDGVETQSGAPMDADGAGVGPDAPEGGTGPPEPGDRSLSGGRTQDAPETTPGVADVVPDAAPPTVSGWDASWTFLEAAGTPAVCVDGTGAIVRATAATEELLGYRPSELADHPLDALVRWESGGQQPESLTAALAGESPRTREFPLSRADGTTLDASIRFVDAAAAGRPGQTVCIIEDASGRRELEEEIAREREKSEQLAAAQKRAEEELGRARERSEAELSRERERAEAALAEQRKAMEELAIERVTVEQYLAEHDDASDELDRTRQEAEDLLASQMGLQETLDLERLKTERTQAELAKLQEELRGEREKITELRTEQVRASEEVARERKKAEQLAEERQRIREELTREREESAKIRVAWSEAEEVLSHERARAEKLFLGQEKAREAITRERDRMAEMQAHLDDARQSLSIETSRTETLEAEAKRIGEQLAWQTERTGELQAELEKARKDAARAAEVSPGGASRRPDVEKRLEEELSRAREERDSHRANLERMEDALLAERKKAESYLAESRSMQTELSRDRDRTRSYLDLASVIFMTLSVDQTVVDINGSGCEILGTGRDGVLGRKWSDTFVPESARAEVKSEFDRLLSGKAREIKEFRSVVLAADGSERSVVWNCSLVTDEEGHPTAALCSGADVPSTEQEEAGMARGLPEQMPDAILVTGIDFAIADANPAAGRLHGCASDDLVGQTPKLVSNGDRASDMRNEIRDSIEQDGIWSGTHSLTGADGTVVTCHTRISPIVDDSGETTGYLFAQRDVTALRRRERFVAASSDAALAMSRARTPSGVLDAAERELRKLGFSCIMMLVDEEEGSIAIKRATGDGGPSAVDTTVVRASMAETPELAGAFEDRQTVFLEDPGSLAMRMLKKETVETAERTQKLFQGGRAALSPLAVDDDAFGVVIVRSPEFAEEHVAFATSFANILAAEWNRATLLEELESALAEMEVAQAQLAHNGEKADVMEVATGVVQQIEGKLEAIVGYADLLASRHGSDDPTREDIGQIKKAIEGAKTLMTQLVTVSSGSAPEDTERLDANVVIKAMEETLRRLVGSEVQVVTVLRPRLDSAIIEKEELERVIADLAVSARDAMAHGGTLTVRTENLSLDAKQLAAGSDGRPGRFVRLSVEDTGEGLDAESLERIFDPSFSPRRRDGRSAPGLSAVHDIVQKRDGWIDVQTGSGRGTVFMIYLPAEEPLAEEKSGRRIVRVPEERILVVEDEMDVRQTAVEALADQGYRVLEAASAEEALTVFAEQGGQIDLVFSNIVLPAMSGTQLADELRAKSPEIRVLLSTGRLDEDYQGTLVREKGLRLLQKPYEPYELVRSIRLAMRAH